MSTPSNEETDHFGQYTSLRVVSSNTVKYIDLKALALYESAKDLSDPTYT